MKKSTIVMGAAALTIIGTTAFLSTSAFAQTTGGQTIMIQKLAQKLGVPEDKVKSAMDELHTERHAEMKQVFEQKLSTLVSEGKITEVQKTAILAKMEELRAKKDSAKANIQTMTSEQRKAQMDAHKAELENWAKSQGIDLSILPFGKFGGMMGGRGDHGGKGMWKMGLQASASPSAQ